MVGAAKAKDGSEECWARVKISCEYGYWGTNSDGGQEQELKLQGSQWEGSWQDSMGEAFVFSLKNIRDTIKAEFITETAFQV